MAQENIYKGDLETFVKLIEPATRQVVLRLSRKAKKHTTCKTEGCHNRKRLQAAHLTGFQNKQIIAAIISRLTLDNKDEINVDDFFRMYEQAHTPLEKVVKIICRDCHLEYGKEQKATGIDTTENLFSEEETDNSKEILNAVNELEKVQKKSKDELIKILSRKHPELYISSGNVSFGTKNQNLSLYWLEPNQKCFDNDNHYFLLFDATQNTYHLINVGRKRFSGKATDFKKRKGGRYKFEILEENNIFTDRFSKVTFEPFLTENLE